MTKNKKIFRLAFLGIFFFLLGGWFFWFWKIKDKSPQYEIERVVKKDLVQTISVTGELKSKVEVNLNFENLGKLNKIRVKAGEKVAEGTSLASIDSSILENQVKQAKAELEQVLAKTYSRKDTIREAETALENAKKQLKQTKKLEKERLESAETFYSNAKNYYNDVLNYYNTIIETHGTESELGKQTKINLTSALNAQENAKKELEIIKQNKDLTLMNAENNQKISQEHLATAQSEFLKKGDDASIEKAQAFYEMSLINLEKASLKSPINGTIGRINYEEGEVLGTKSGSFASVISDDFIIEADIPESDIAKIKQEQEVEITFDAIDEKKFLGRIIEIEPVATLMQDVVYYKAKIKMNEFDQQLKHGMSADLEIKTATKKDVLTISQYAIKKEEGVKKVNILLPTGKIALLKIETGLENDKGEVEVISGLNNNDSVAIFQDEK